MFERILISSAMADHRLSTDDGEGNEQLLRSPYVWIFDLLRDLADRRSVGISAIESHESSLPIYRMNRRDGFFGD